MNINRNNQKGFTLIELAIVLIMFGFTSSAILFAFKTYNEQTRVRHTNTAIENSRDAIAMFVEQNGGRYPCPSDFDAAEGDADYGFEIIMALDTNDTSPANLALIDAALDTIAADARDVDNADGDGDPDTGVEEYLYGGIPFNTLRDANGSAWINAIAPRTFDIDFSEEDAIDGWGNKITYAVSRHLCDPSHPLYGESFGVLDVIIEDDVACTTDGSLDPEWPVNMKYPRSILPSGRAGSCGEVGKKYAQFVLVSHGENGNGAHTTQGNEIGDCNDIILGPPPPPGPADTAIFASGYPSEEKNCKFDTNNGQFLSALKNEDEDNYFDDYVKFQYEDSYHVWAMAQTLTIPDPDPMAPLGATIDISRAMNVNPGNIGVNTGIPEESVHVEGDVLAHEFQAGYYCDNSEDGNIPGNCMPAETLAGAPGVENDMACGMNGRDEGYIKSIEDNHVNCENPFDGKDFSCGLDADGKQQYLKAIRSDGTFDCVTP